MVTEDLGLKYSCMKIKFMKKVKELESAKRPSFEICICMYMVTYLGAIQVDENTKT